MSSTTMRKLTMARAISEAIAQEMEQDPRVLVWGEDVGIYGGIFGATQGLYQKFGESRVIDTPISESAFIGAAIGASAEGLRPIVELMFVDFFGVAMDQIYNHLAKNHYMSGGSFRHPVVLMTAIGGGYSDAAQHSQSLYGLFAHVPGLKVVVPSNAYDAKGLMLTAIRDDDPVMYFFHKGLLGLGWMPSDDLAEVHVPEEPYTIPFGQAHIAGEGQDVTVVTIGAMVPKSLRARDRLRQEGISVEVIDLRTLVPLDQETVLNSVKKTHRLLVVDEDYRSFGMSGEIAAMVAEHALDYLDAPIRRLAVPDVPIPYSRVLEQAVIPSVDAISAAIRELV
ncbi:Transketolase, pyridine binding domain protein [Sulfobacillus acidophilus TPY]|uniref:Pyruvate dehydrogenase (Acetyl-transferring) n=1 Tax=Sulfobacillus acidophilus (strain ATCC 700253 / DSM 10332 / NAL) TaxID=679936 RepID=G8TYG2_SULAD|nr:Transketolase, pyridine binding domain protein [Sulfobacillus acidophilus TPY]AEW06223.1 Pyruvate dehydrogenase (acetyl-transferring) [Sulfobacillus acidophilus DSM 10332]